MEWRGGGGGEGRQKYEVLRLRSARLAASASLPMNPELRFDTVPSAYRRAAGQIRVAQASRLSWRASRAAQRGLAAIHACACSEEVFRGTRKTTGGTPALPKERAADILIFEFIAAASKT